MTTPADLPSPVTAQDMWVKAVHDRLVEQNDLLRQLLDRTPVPVEKAAAGGGAVLVTEPAPARPSPAKTLPRKQTSRR